MDILGVVLEVLHVSPGRRGVWGDRRRRRGEVAVEEGRGRGGGGGGEEEEEEEGGGGGDEGKLITFHTSGYTTMATF